MQQKKKYIFLIWILKLISIKSPNQIPPERNMTKLHAPTSVTFVYSTDWCDTHMQTKRKEKRKAEGHFLSIFWT